MFDNIALPGLESSTSHRRQVQELVFPCVYQWRIEAITEGKDMVFDQQPIFVVGSPRAGTSILAQAISTGLDLTSYSEGHVLPLLKALVDSVESYYQTKQRPVQIEGIMISHVPRERIEGDLIEIFRRIYRDHHPARMWLDKTGDPEMIQATPLILRAWPQSHFIFAKRRGIENILSRLRKFPNNTFEYHCKHWASCMQTWLEYRDRLNGQWLEVDQRDIAVYPDRTARAIGEFLQVDEKRIHRIASAFKNNRPERTSQISDQEEISLDETGWNEEQKRIFREYCSEMMQAFGYSF